MDIATLNETEWQRLIEREAARKRRNRAWEILGAELIRELGDEKTARLDAIIAKLEAGEIK